MTGAGFTEQGHLDAFGGVVIDEAELFHHATATKVSLVMTAPKAVCSQRFKGIAFLPKFNLKLPSVFLLNQAFP